MAPSERYLPRRAKSPSGGAAIGVIWLTEGLPERTGRLNRWLCRYIDLDQQNGQSLPRVGDVSMPLGRARRPTPLWDSSRASASPLGGTACHSPHDRPYRGSWRSLERGGSGSPRAKPRHPLRVSQSWDGPRPACPLPNRRSLLEARRASLTDAGERQGWSHARAPSPVVVMWPSAAGLGRNGALPKAARWATARSLVVRDGQPAMRSARAVRENRR